MSGDQFRTLHITAGTTNTVHEDDEDRGFRDKNTRSTVILWWVVVDSGADEEIRFERKFSDVPMFSSDDDRVAHRAAFVELEHNVVAYLNTLGSEGWTVNQYDQPTDTNRPREPYGTSVHWAPPCGHYFMTRRVESPDVPDGRRILELADYLAVDVDEITGIGEVFTEDSSGVEVSIRSGARYWLPGGASEARTLVTAWRGQMKREQWAEIPKQLHVAPIRSPSTDDDPEPSF